ncbi:MAG: hypothetical protein RIC55_35765 [Pirellulaceae bacterium]
MTDGACGDRELTAYPLILRAAQPTAKRESIVSSSRQFYNAETCREANREDATSDAAAIWRVSATATGGLGTDFASRVVRTLLTTALERRHSRIRNVGRN